MLELEEVKENWIEMLSFFRIYIGNTLYEWYIVYFRSPVAAILILSLIKGIQAAEMDVYRGASK